MAICATLIVLVEAFVIIRREYANASQGLMEITVAYSDLPIGRCWSEVYSLPPTCNVATIMS